MFISRHQVSILHCVLHINESWTYLFIFTSMFVLRFELFSQFVFCYHSLFHVFVGRMVWANCRHEPFWDTPQLFAGPFAARPMCSLPIDCCCCLLLGCLLLVASVAYCLCTCLLIVACCLLTCCLLLLLLLPVARMYVCGHVAACLLDQCLYAYCLYAVAY